MALTVGRASEDRAQERDMVAARDHFQIFLVQRTGAHPIERPIIILAPHKFLLLVSGSSLNMETAVAWLSLGVQATMIFMAYTA